MLEKLGQVDKKTADQFRAATQAYTHQQEEIKRTTDKVEELGGKAEKVHKKHSEAVKHTRGEFERLEDRMRSVAEKIVAVFAVERILHFGKEAVKAFAEADASVNKLRFSLNKLSGEGAIGFDRLITQSEKLSKTTYFSPSQIQGVQAAAAAFGLNSKEIEQLLPHTADLAVILQTDLKGAWDIQARAIEGTTKGLKLAGQDFKAIAGDPIGNFNKLLLASAKGAGQAEAALHSTDGILKNLAKDYEIAKEKIGGFLVGLTNGFRTENDVTFQNIKANREAADSSKLLLAEYEKLTAKGVKPTAAEKDRLKIITLQLKDALGESVVAIDKETGALTLNKDAVREAIKQKLFLANQSAVQIAAQLDANQQDEKATNDRIVALRSESEVRNEINKKLGIDKVGSTLNFTKEQNKAYQELIETNRKLAESQKHLTELDEKDTELTKKLTEAGYSRNDVYKLFNEEQKKDLSLKSHLKTDDTEKEKKIAQFKEDLRKRFLDAEIAGIEDETERKKAELIKQFEDNITFVEKGVKEGLIKRAEGVDDIHRLESNFQDGITAIDDAAQAARDKKQSEENTKQADKDFKLTVANLEKEEQAEINAIEAKYLKQTDHSVKAEAEKEKQILNVKEYYALQAKLLYEDDPAKRAEIDKRILEIQKLFGDADLKITKDREDKKREILKQTYQELEKLGVQFLENSFLYTQAQAQADSERIQSALDNQNKASDEAGAILQKQFDRHLISETQFNKEKKKLDQKREADANLARKKENDIKHQQDLAERDRKLFEIAIQTAVNIVQFPLLTPFYLGLGAAEAAVVLATPLPKYHAGQKAKLSSKEQMAIVREDEYIFSPEKSREFDTTFDAIHRGKIKPSVLNEFVSYKLKPQSFAQNISNSIDYDRLGKSVAEWIVFKNKNQGVTIRNIGDLAELMKPDFDPRWRG